MKNSWIDKLADNTNYAVIAIAILCLVIYIVMNAKNWLL